MIKHAANMERTGLRVIAKHGGDRKYIIIKKPGNPNYLKNPDNI